MQAPHTTQSLTTGTTIDAGGDSFEILAEVGRGGMGVVYRAMQQSLQRVVALKMLPPEMVADEQLMQRLLREARLCGTLSHPNIVRMFSLATTDAGVPFLIMEFVEGRTLADILAETKTLKDEQFIDYFSQILAALEELHAHGLVHRDLKPANIMVTTDATIKLMDFGIAKDIGGMLPGTQGITQTGAIVGSPWYMSPEQCRGEALDARADLYSVGCVMYECLTGEHPFAGDNALEVMYKHLHDQVSTTGQLNIPHHSAVVMKAMAKAAEDRYATAWEMREALRLTTDEPVGKIRKQRARQISKKHFALTALIASMVLVTSVCLMVKLTSHTPPSPKPEADMEARDLVEQGKDAWEMQSDPKYTRFERNQLNAKAARYFRAALAREGELNPDAQITALWGAARSYVSEDPEKALNLFKQVHENIGSDMHMKMQAALEVADQLTRMQRFKEALAMCESSEKTLQQVERSKPGIAMLFYTRKADVLIHLGRIKDAEDVWLTVSKTVPAGERNNIGFLSLRARYGTSLVMRREYALAVPFLAETCRSLDELRSSYVKQKLAVQLPNVDNLLAEQYFYYVAALSATEKWREFDIALPKAIHWDEETDQYNRVAGLHMQASREAAVQGNARRAADECALAVTYWKKHSTPPSEEIFNAYALEYWYRQSVSKEDAIRVCDDALELTKTAKYRPDQWTAFSIAKGGALLALGKLDEAEKVLLDSEKQIRKDNSKAVANWMLMYQYLAELYDRRHNQAMAKHYYNLSLEYANMPESQQQRPDIATTAKERYEAFTKGTIKY